MVNRFPVEIGATCLQVLGLVRDHIRDVGLPGGVVLSAQPAIIAGVGRDTVQAEFGSRGVDFVQEAVQRQNAGALYFILGFVVFGGGRVGAFPVKMRCEGASHLV